MKTHSSKPKYFLFSTIVLLIAAQVGRAVTLYVSPEGNDRWSGLLAEPNRERTDGPLASLAGARDAIRQLKSKGPLTAPVLVDVAAGTYILGEPFILTSQDSGTKQCTII